MSFQSVFDITNQFYTQISFLFRIFLFVSVEFQPFAANSVQVRHLFHLNHRYFLSKWQIVVIPLFFRPNSGNDVCFEK